MSRGTPITPLRLPRDLVEQIDRAIAQNNRTRFGEPWNRTSWIVQAIKERLAKQERSRRSNRGRPHASRGEGAS